MKYFHAQWKIRSRANAIKSIHHDAGTNLTDPEDIEAEFITFLPTLWDRRGMYTLGQMQR